MMFLRMLKQRNDELFEENHHLQQEKHRQKESFSWRSSLQQAFVNEPQQQLAPPETIVPSSSVKLANADPRRERPKSKYTLTRTHS